MEITITNLKVPDLENDLFNHFQNEKYMKGLITLYLSSQIECSRSAGLTPEVGSSRERDLISSFVTNKKLSVHYNIANNKEEDIIINDKKISIKHSSNKIKSQFGIKIVWTVDNDKRNEFVQNYKFCCDLIIIYVRFSSIYNGELEILYIPIEKLLELQSTFAENNMPIFKCLDGNSRGIEFDKKFFEQIILNVLFHIKIVFKNDNCELCNPIMKRVKMLELMYDE